MFNCLWPSDAMWRHRTDLTLAEVIASCPRGLMFTNSWWRHEMQICSALLALCAWNSPVTGQWHGALMFSLICGWTNGWVNNRDAGDLRRYRAHYSATVMYPWSPVSWEGNFTSDASAINFQNQLEIIYLKLQSNLPEASGLTHCNA